MSLRLAFAFATSLVLGCKGPSADSRIIELTQLSSQETREGQVLFMRFCHSCHPDGDAGLGPSLHGVRHLSPLVHMQVRLGMGEMPAFDDEIPDEDLDAILAYLRHLDDKG